jgi:RHS repeat-associated protein
LAAGDGVPGWVRKALQADQRVPLAPWTDSPAAALRQPVREPAARVAATFPGAGSAVESVGDPKAVPSATKPVVVRPVGTPRSAAEVEVKVLDAAAAQRAGVTGFVFEVGGTGGKSLREVAKAVTGGSALPAQLLIDSSPFAEAYGGGYASRLRVVNLPACALALPRPANCAAAGVPLKTTRDDAGRLVVDVADLADVAALAVTSGVSGDDGNWGATPLSLSSKWNVGQGTGEFSYTYPFDLPAPAGGKAPEVGLSYSSGAMDMLTHSTNTQGSPTGSGWGDFANAFIERSYKPCYIVYHDKPHPGNNIDAVEDLCWSGYNATISLGGISGNLVPLDNQYRSWRLVNDPGWKVERSGAAADGQFEYWTVTGPDGTRYVFGQHENPYAPDENDPRHFFQSVLWAPIYTARSTDPCYGAHPEWTGGNHTMGVCRMGWRWMLDQVIDPDGNYTTYWYTQEQNHYGGLLGVAGNLLYLGSAVLARIEYGNRPGPNNKAAARVVFNTGDRCAGSSVCDVPTDLLCDSSNPCSQHAPSFFSRLRYGSVRADVFTLREAANPYSPVVQYNLQYNISGVDKRLYLQGIQLVGVAQSGLLPYPLTKFGYGSAPLPNRVDCRSGDTACQQGHWRLREVDNSYGGKTAVTYGLPVPCNSNWPNVLTENSTVRWDKNYGNCFPQDLPNKNLGSNVQWFNKWLVTSVTETPGFGSTPTTTSYSYEDPRDKDNPLWAFDNMSYDSDQSLNGWWNWRGYGTVSVTTGGATKTRTRVRLFRGMYQDKTLVDIGGSSVCPCGTRYSQVTTLTEDPQASYPDDVILAGRTLEQRSLVNVGAANEQPGQSTRYTYAIKISAQPFDPDFYPIPPHWAAADSETERVYAPNGGFRERGSKTTFNDNQQPIATSELGWLTDPGDDRCSVTTYADNPSKGMFVYPSTNRVLGGACPANGDYSGMTEVSASETYYDEAPGTQGQLGAPPVRGNPTRQRVTIDSSNSSTTTTEYDIVGRPTKVTDPTGAATTTVYTAPMAWGIPNHTETTNALSQKTTTDVLPEFGAPTRVTDPNGNVTTYAYDAVGRVTGIRLPTEQGLPGDDSQSFQFAYFLSDNYSAAPMVRSRRYTSNSTSAKVFEDTWTVYDGMLRERETLIPIPNDSNGNPQTLASATSYDDRGNVFDETEPEAVPGAPGLGVMEPAMWANRTRHFYDELGRAASDSWMRGNTNQSTTTYSYDGDTSTVTGPDGLKAQTKVDGLGRTTSQSEWNGTGWDTSTFGYNLADKLTSVRDPAGNTIGYSYNEAGWRTGQTDPDRGNGLYGYDAAGRMTASVDGNANVLVTKYDVLGRKTELRKDSTTGALLASWSYDTAPGGKGMLASSTRKDAGGDWTTAVTGYDARGRATGTTLTVPNSVTGLAGTYTVTTSYDRADRPITVTYPAKGGLPQETVTTTYNGNGLPSKLTGIDTYVNTLNYDTRLRPSVRSAGPGAGSPFGWGLSSWTYDADQRLASSTQNVWDGSAYKIVDEHGLQYLKDGRVIGQTLNLNGASWRECYGYDPRGRLNTAYTTTSGACDGSGKGTGPNPFNHTYAYSPDGNLTKRNEGGADIVYGYPAAGQAHPHAATSVGADQYVWDNAGNLKQRNTDTLTWDTEQHLTSMSGTSMVYDADGTRLLRRSPAGTTLYWAGQEITVPAGSSTATAVRSYSMGGRIVATRTPAGVSYLTAGDDGSVESAVPAGGTAPSGTRTYSPYGKVRNTTGANFDTGRGFLGQIEDPSTKLSYLNARYYDPSTGIFASADPLFDTTELKSLNPYVYASGNPETMSDPTGLYSSRTHGLEASNAQLRAINKTLIADIGRLGGQIKELQGIIRQQQKVINDLIGRIEALQAIIRQQQTVITQLQARIRYLVGVVNAQAREIHRLRGQVAYWRGQADQWRSKANYYRRVVGDLVAKLWYMVFPTGSSLTVADSTSLVLGPIDKGQWHGLEGLPVSLADMFYTQKWRTQSQLADVRGQLASVQGKYRNLQQEVVHTLKESNEEEGFNLGEFACHLVEGFSIGHGLLDLAEKSVSPELTAALVAAEFACA